MKTTAIVILNWNGKHWLEKFLPNVISNSQGATIYVIDNASTDDSVAFLSSGFPQVTIIRNTKNSGFAGGYNEGLKHISADIYCLLNSDVEVTENWLTPVLEIFERDQSIAAVQPKVLDYNRRNYFEFAGAAGGFIDNLGYPYCRGVYLNLLRKTGDSITTKPKFYGLRVAVCSSVHLIFGNSMVLMKDSLPTRRKSICAGVLKIQERRFFTPGSLWFIM